VAASKEASPDHPVVNPVRPVGAVVAAGIRFRSFRLS
jgi:hypothetical protein